MICSSFVVGGISVDKAYLKSWSPVPYPVLDGILLRLKRGQSPTLLCEWDVQSCFSPITFAKAQFKMQLSTIVAAQFEAPACSKTVVRLRLSAPPILEVGTQECCETTSRRCKTLWTHYVSKKKKLDAFCTALPSSLRDEFAQATEYKFIVDDPLVKVRAEFLKVCTTEQLEQLQLDFSSASSQAPAPQAAGGFENGAPPVILPPSTNLVSPTPSRKRPMSSSPIEKRLSPNERRRAVDDEGRATQPPSIENRLSFTEKMRAMESEGRATAQPSKDSTCPAPPAVSELPLAIPMGEELLDEKSCKIKRILEEMNGTFSKQPDMGSDGVKCDGCHMDFAAHLMSSRDNDKIICERCKYTCCELCWEHPKRGTCFCRDANFGDAYPAKKKDRTKAMTGLW